MLYFKKSSFKKILVIFCNDLLNFPFMIISQSVAIKLLINIGTFKKENTLKIL
jgi:hypothetical protein